MEAVSASSPQFIISTSLSLPLAMSPTSPVMFVYARHAPSDLTLTSAALYESLQSRPLFR